MELPSDVYVENRHGLSLNQYLLAHECACDITSTQIHARGELISPSIRRCWATGRLKGLGCRLERAHALNTIKLLPLNRG